VRDAVNAKLEEQRQAKVIGNALEAQVVLHATGHYAALLEAHADQLAPLFIVSDVVVTTGPSRAPFSTVAAVAQVVTGQPTVADEPSTLTVEVRRAPGVKCERCWRYVTEVRAHGEAAGLCLRCEAALGLAETVA